MKHKILITSLCTVFALPAFAADMQTPPNGERGPRGGGMPMMQNLTEEQKTCMQNAMAQCGIEMPTPPEDPTNGQSVQPRQ
ncbi:MAG: hypothetical protein IJX89_04400 [Alphaproteobacteria bacterium]|nr:hypothetical protein [Alphaproteobacteria bacterium]